MIAKSHQKMAGKPATCHPKKVNWARGLCKNCYDKWLRKNNPTYVEKQRRNTAAWHKLHPEKVRQNSRNFLAKQQPDYERKRHLKRNWGITQGQYEEMLAKQDGKCAICLRPPKANRNLAIDHCHETGQIRGLLCFRCNFGLSFFSESAEVMSRAARYLRKTQK